MPDFVKVAAPVFTPTQCATCSTQHDPKGFLDLGVDLPVSGHLYICAGCLGQAAGHLGWIEPRVAEEIRAESRSDKSRIAELLGDLARAEGRGSWTFTPAETAPEPGAWLTVNDLRDPLACPDCGQPKTETAKRCRSCSSKVALAARQTKATA